MFLVCNLLELIKPLNFSKLNFDHTKGTLQLGYFMPHRLLALFDGTWIFCSCWKRLALALVLLQRLHQSHRRPTIASSIPMVPAADRHDLDLLLADSYLQLVSNPSIVKSITTLSGVVLRCAPKELNNVELTVVFAIGQLRRGKGGRAAFTMVIIWHSCSIEKIWLISQQSLSLHSRICSRRGSQVSTPFRLLAFFPGDLSSFHRPRSWRVLRIPSWYVVLVSDHVLAIFLVGGEGDIINGHLLETI